MGLGLAIIFSSTGVLNFAQGDVVMVGTLLALSLWGRMGWPLVLVAVAGRAPVHRGLRPRGAIAGLGGLVIGPITQASYSVGIPSTLQGFVAATIGGITRPWGPLVGGLLLGLTIQFTTAYWDAAYINMVELIVLLLVLLVRPAGVLGRRVRTV